MNTRDQFGNYLLLKKLAEDPLGETFRAGKLGKQSLERVVLLRVLNGAGFDAERIARALQSRSTLSGALKSPTIGQATDVGQVRGVPYIAYDYTSGRSLAQLLEQAARGNSPLPLDHALLIAERVALALAVAHETRFGDQRVQHGFVTPQLVQVTNEGELKLLGFEASTGLRESATNPIVRQAVGRFLAPEALAGQPPAKSDDVYSIGALLFEMITGQASASQAGAIGSAVVAYDGSPLPPELGALLQRTVCVRDQRVPDIVAWHKSLAGLMADNGWAATTFNLAFFLHNLFRDEIDRESRELESEKNQAPALAAAVARAPEPTPAPAAASAVRTSGPVREDTNVLRDEYGIPAKKRSGPSPAVIGGAALGVIVLAVGGYLLFGRGGSGAPPAQPAPQTPTPQAAAPAGGMTPEEIQALLDSRLTKQKEEIEAGLKATSSQQAEEIRALQRQLEDAQRVRTSSPPPSVQIAAQPTPTPAAAPTPAASEPQTAAAAPTSAAAEARAAEPATTTSPATSAGASTTPASPQRPAAAPAQAPAARPASATPAPATPPTATGVKRGDLVAIGPGVTPPRVVRQPPLAYPQVARRLRKEANLTVRVLVDEEGDVAEVQAVGPKAGFGLDEAALSHARNCVWTPATKDGVKVKMWTDLKVVFKL